MKKLLIYSAALFAACASLVSCNKEITENEVASTTHSVSFIAEELDTKTSMTIDGNVATFAWEDADKSHMYVYEDDTKSEVVEAKLNGTKLEVKALFDGDAPASPTYYAHLNSDITVQVPSENCYDGAADVLVAEPLTAADRGGNDNLPLLFSRKVAVNKMTVKGLEPGAAIEEVTITADKDIAGVFEKDTWTTKTTTLSILSEEIVAGEDGNAVVYFTCLPVENANLTIDVTTDCGNYTKEFAKPITFTEGAVKAFGVTVTKAETLIPGYYKVSSTEYVTEGKYLIVGNAYKTAVTEAGYFVLPNAFPATAGKVAGVPISVTDGFVSYSDGAQYEIELRKSENGFNIVSDSNHLAYNKTNLLAATSNDEWIAVSSGNSVFMQNVVKDGTTTRAVAFQLYYYSNNTNTPRLAFGAYSISNIGTDNNNNNHEGYGHMELYKYSEVPGATPDVHMYNISISSVTGGTISASASTAVAGTSVTISAYPELGYKLERLIVTNSSTSEEISVDETGVFLMPASDVNVTASFIAIPSLTTIDDIYNTAVDNGSESSTEVLVTFNDWYVSGINGSSAYVTDGTKGFIMYTSNHGFEVGDKLSGIVACSLTLYGGAAELTGVTSTATGLSVTKNNSVPVYNNVVYSDLDYINTGCVVSFSNLTCTSVTNSKEASFKDSENNIWKCYGAMYEKEFKVDGVYNITGVFQKFYRSSVTMELMPRSDTDVATISEPDSVDDVVLYSTGFENEGEHRESGANSYSATTYGKWATSFADIISNTAMTGSYMAQGRVAKNTTNSPSITSSNLISGEHTIKSVTFEAKSPAAFTMKFEYSVDGNNWIEMAYSPTKSTSKVKHTVSFTTPLVTSDFRIRLTYTVSSTTNSNRDGQWDSIEVLGK